MLLILNATEISKTHITNLIFALHQYERQAIRPVICGEIIGALLRQTESPILRPPSFEPNSSDVFAGLPAARHRLRQRPCQLHLRPMQPLVSETDIELNLIWVLMFS